MRKVRWIVDTTDDFQFKIWTYNGLGDTNDDGIVDIVDLNNVRNNFGNTGPQPLLGDRDWDGVVGISDLNNSRNDFGVNFGSDWGATPPPLGSGAMGATSGGGESLSLFESSSTTPIGEERLRQVLSEIYFDRTASRDSNDAFDDLVGWKELGDARWWSDLLGSGWRGRL